MEEESEWVRGIRLQLEASERDWKRVDETGCWAPPGWKEWSIHEQLWARRRFAGMSQRAVSAASGIAQSQISRFEAGGDPHWSTLDRLAFALDCELVLRLRPRDPEKPRARR